jgi:hypothetical protein
MANGSLIIRKKLDIANEKYAIGAQIRVRPKKNQKNFIFLLTLCVTYVTIVNVTDVIVRRLI